MKKQISTTIGIVIIVVVAAIAFGGVFAYEYLGTKIQPAAYTQQNQSSDSIPSSPVTTKLNVIVLPTQNGVSGTPAPYPNSVAVTGISANEVSVYGAAYQIWLGPKGWTGTGRVGTDGGIAVNLYPTNGSPQSDPHIFYSLVPGCIGCMLDGASPYFANALQTYNSEFNQDGTNPIKIPQGLEITKISPTLVTYTLPDQNGMSTSGVVYYDSTLKSQFPYAQAEFILPISETSLSNSLIQFFIKQEGLK